MARLRRVTAALAATRRVAAPWEILFALAVCGGAVRGGLGL